MSLKKFICAEKNFERRPRGRVFTTTASDTALLPEGLSQSKENYRVIFKDEFSESGGPEKLDLVCG